MPPSEWYRGLLTSAHSSVFFFFLLQRRPFKSFIISLFEKRWHACPNESLEARSCRSAGKKKEKKEKAKVVSSWHGFTFNGVYITAGVLKADGSSVKTKQKRKKKRVNDFHRLKTVHALSTSLPKTNDVARRGIKALMHSA